MLDRSLLFAGALLLLIGAPACSDSGGSDTEDTSTASSESTSDSTTTTTTTTTTDPTTSTETTAETTTEGTESETTSTEPDFPPGCELPEPEGGFMDWCGPDNPTCAEGHGCYLFGGTRGVCSLSCESDADCVWGPDDMCADERFTCVEANSGLMRCLMTCESQDDCFAGTSCVPPFNVCLPDEP